MINDDNWQQNKFLQCNFDITNKRLTPLQPFSALYVQYIPLRSIRFYRNIPIVQQYTTISTISLTRTNSIHSNNRNYNSM